MFYDRIRIHKKSHHKSAITREYMDWFKDIR